MFVVDRFLINIVDTVLAVKLSHEYIKLKNKNIQWKIFEYFVPDTSTHVSKPY